LLTCELPFSGETVTSVAYQHCHTPFPDIGQKAAGLPNAARQILARGGQKDPAGRFQTAAELLVELDALLGTVEVSHTFDESATEKRERALAVATSRRKGRIAALAGGCAALVVGIAAIAIWHGRYHETTAIAPVTPVPAASVPLTPTPPISSATTPPAIPSSSPLVLPKAPGLFRTLKGHAKKILHVEFLPDSWHLLSSAEGNENSRIWELPGGTSTELAGNGAALSEGGRWLSVGKGFFRSDTLTAVH